MHSNILKKNALITGATSGIGFQILKLLYKLNYNIYAVGRDFSSLNDYQDINKIQIDLTNLKDVEKIFTKLSKEIEFDFLLNCAGFGIFKQHEDIKIEEINNMVTLNLTVPIILSKLLLKSLKNKSGIIINIASIEAIRYSKFSALYSSTKAGLRSFSLSLFEEVRKYGVKIVVINPDMTKTNFFNKLSFNVGDNNLSYLEVFDIKEIVKTILNTNVNCCLTEITVRPQKIEIKKQKN